MWTRGLPSAQAKYACGRTPVLLLRASRMAAMAFGPAGASARRTRCPSTSTPKPGLAVGLTDLGRYHVRQRLLAENSNAPLEVPRLLPGRRQPADLDEEASADR
jgi:hypothetical protein